MDALRAIMIMEREVYKKLISMHSEIGDFITYEPNENKRMEMFKIRERIQDSLRAMQDKQTLRKDLPY